MYSLRKEIQAKQKILRQPRIFRDQTNPLDYLNDMGVIERCRLPKVFLYRLIDLVNADIQRMTRPGHCLLQYRC